MPAARNGDVRSQVSIADWLGATHWSNPWPVKLPGVTGLSANAGAGPTRRPAVVSRPVKETGGEAAHESSWGKGAGRP